MNDNNEAASETEAVNSLVMFFTKNITKNRRYVELRIAGSRNSIQCVVRRDKLKWRLEKFNTNLGHGVFSKWREHRLKVKKTYNKAQYWDDVIEVANAIIKEANASPVIPTSDELLSVANSVVTKSDWLASLNLMLKVLMYSKNPTEFERTEQKRSRVELYKKEGFIAIINEAARWAMLTDIADKLKEKLATKKEKSMS